MPGDPETMAETSGAMVVAPARVPRAERGINALPDDLLRRVLSFLNAREAVQTCVLSKLWRNLWRDARRINASWRAVETKNCGCDDQFSSPFNFKKFVSRLLMLRNAVPLDEFRLLYCIDGDRFYPDHAEPNLWIRHALLCEARSVEIFLCEEGDRLELNRAVFTSEHLTRLLLYSVYLLEGFFRQLQTGCKALECLILLDCTIGDIEIASQTLKILSIGTCWISSQTLARRASLSLPNLIHLGFFYHSTECDMIPLVKNMDSLKTAYVDLHKFDDLTVGDIRQFLLGLSGVTKLEFCFGSGQEELMLGMDLQWCPKFNNLKFLSLGNWYLDANFYGLITFLQKSPNLEHLTLNLKEEQYAEVPGALMGWPGNRPFECKHLKTVKIICLEDDPVVDSLTQFLIESGISDDKIHIEH